MELEKLQQIDPIPHIEELVAQQRYAEANEYLDFFMTQDYVKNDPAATALATQIQAEREKYSYRLRKLADGVLTGQSDETEGQIAGIISDFLIIGDVRDLTSESWNWWKNEPVDEVIMALSAIGVVATASTIATAGGSAVTKPVLSFLKMVRKIGQIPSWLQKMLLASAETAKKTRDLSAIKELFSAIFHSVKASGGLGTVKLLNAVDDAQDFKRVAPVAAQLGRKTGVFITLVGKDGLAVAAKNPDVAVYAATFGKPGIKMLNALGDTAFLTKMTARTTKVVYKHHEFLLESLKAVPIWILMVLLVFCLASLRRQQA